MATGRSSTALREKAFHWLLLAPAFALLCALTLFPLLYNVWLSFHHKHTYLPQRHFVGVSNYIGLMRDAEFYSSFRAGFVYALASVTLQVTIGTAAALLLNERFRGRNFVRGVLLFPYLIPTVVVVILWKWLLNATYGLINYLGVTSGLLSIPVHWFSRDNIMTTLVVLSTWQFFPFVVVTILARLQTIPEELYRAARIDNAPAVARFAHVTLPQLRGVLMTVTLLRVIWMFTKFDTVWLLAGREGIGKYIQTLPVYTYRVTFEYLQAGVGAALSVILLLFLVIASTAYVRMFREDGGRL